MSLQYSATNVKTTAEKEAQTERDGEGERLANINNIKLHLCIKLGEIAQTSFSEEKELGSYHQNKIRIYEYYDSGGTILANYFKNTRVFYQNTLKLRSQSSKKKKTQVEEPLSESQL